MIVAVVNHAPGSGKTALAVHLAGELALRGRRVLLADAGLEAGALRWAEARRRNGHAALFETVGLDRELIAAGRLRRALAGLSDGADPVIVDTPPRPFDRLSEVLAACDLVLLPVPADGAALSGSRAAIAAALWERRRRPDLAVRVVYTRVRGAFPVRCWPWSTARVWSARRRPCATSRPCPGLCRPGCSSRRRRAVGRR